ncbi:MAG: DUF349 domain-containing protein [Candidatus Competibacter sp.]|nr:DUF349 domain-containing protein [Candidatus Competibacter sp.]
MILSRFLKPKWPRAEPANRQQALRDLDRADPKLTELARHDPDPSIRRGALERLVDLDVLQALAGADADDSVRAAARDRYREVLAGKIADGPPLAERLERLRRDPDDGLVAFVLQHAAESELRLAALGRVDTEPALVEIALQNSHQDLRAAALERIEHSDALDRIVRQSRNRDKRLYRRARERLDERLAAQARAGQLERLCAEMEQLRWDGESGPNAGRFPKLEQEWRGQEATASEAVRERYAQARARFLAERQASAGRRTQRLELVARLESLLERLRQETQTDTELAASIQQALQETPGAWAQLGPAQDAESRRLEQRFQHLTHDIKEQERILHRNQLRAERLHEVLRQAEALLEQPSEVREIDLKQLRQRWDGLERPESRELSSQLQNRLDGLFDKLRARLQRQVQQRDQEWQELQDLADQLEKTLEEGELQHATQLHDQTRQRLKHNIGLTRAQMATIEERLQHCAGRIGELRDWRRWGTHQAREQLCIAAEQLVGLEADPADIAQRIQQTRAAWKDLDHHEGAAPKVLWKRFNEACERAYAPCQAHFEAQNRERQHNLEKKQALCDQLEQFEAATDWGQVDWREADRLRQRARESWYKLGPVNRSDRKSLDRRFQQIAQRLDARLSVEREREIQRRQQLIQHVQSLLESPDLRAAIEAAKRAQAEWHPTVQAPPRQEQALWKEFRAICDAVFARRQSEQQAADAERQTNLAQRLSLCEEIEALATVEHEQLAAAQARLQAAQQEWEILGAIPKSEQRTLHQRFETAIRQFARHERLLRQTGTRENFKHLHARSRVCARLERLLALAPVDPGLLLQDRESWNALPPLPEALLEPIQRRFDTAARALTEAPERAPELIAALEQNLERKRIWCLCLEIVAGVESPPEWAQQRMEYQVARLSASLAGASAKNGDALYDPRLLQEQWCLTGALPAEPEAALDARFLDALRAWRQREEL